MLDQIIAHIKAKRELQHLDDSFVEELVQKQLQSNKKLREKINVSESFEKLKKSKVYDQLVKDIRAKLREIYGVFILDDFEKLFEEYKQRKVKIRHLLEAHQSTKERFMYYPRAYPRIFNITGNPKIIMDLACGMNPLSYSFLGCHPEYIAVDIAQKDIDIIAEFFKLYKVKATTIAADLTHFNEWIDLLPKADVCFLFKTLDTLEAQQRHISKKLIPRLFEKVKWVVVSFSKKSIGGKKNLRASARSWFEKWIEKERYNSESFEVFNELFYVIRT